MDCIVRGSESDMTEQLSLYIVYKLSLRIWNIFGGLHQATVCKQQNVYAEVDNTLQINSEASI